MAGYGLTPAGLKALDSKRDSVTVCHAPSGDLTRSVVLRDGFPKAVAIAFSTLFADAFKESCLRSTVTVKGGNEKALHAIFDHMLAMCRAHKITPFPSFECRPVSRSVLVHEAAKILKIAPLENEMQERINESMQLPMTLDDVSFLYQTSHHVYQQQVAARVAELGTQGKLFNVQHWADLRRHCRKFQADLDGCLQAKGTNIDSILEQHERQKDRARQAREDAAKAAEEKRAHWKEETARKVRRHEGYLAWMERKQARVRREAAVAAAAAKTYAVKPVAPLQTVSVEVEVRHGKRWAKVPLMDLGVDHNTFIGKGKVQRGSKRTTAAVEDVSKVESRGTSTL